MWGHGLLGHRGATECWVPGVSCTKWGYTPCMPRFDSTFCASLTIQAIRESSTSTEQLTIFMRRRKSRNGGCLHSAEAQNEVCACSVFVFLWQFPPSPLLVYELSLKEKKRRKLYRSIKASFNPLSFPLLLFLPLLSLVTGNQCVYMAGILSSCRWGHRSSTVTGLLHSHLAVLPSQPPFISIRIPSLPLALLSLSPFVPPWRARASSEFRGETSP